MRIVAAIALLFGAQFAAVGLHALGSNGDLAWQQWLGEYVLRFHHLPSALGSETFTATGAKWIPQEWLFSTILALSLRAHVFPIFAFVSAAVACCALIVTAARARARGASALATLLTTIFVGISCSQMYGVRTQIAAWLLLALFLLVLERRDAWSFAAIPIVALWVNFHASAMLAPVLAVIWTAGIALDEGWHSPHALRCAYVSAACALATFVTPLGAALPLYAVHLVASPIRAHIQEWHTPRFGDGSFTVGFAPLIVGGIAALAHKRARRREILLFIAAVFLAAQAIRNVPLASIIAAPLVAQWISPYLTDHSRAATLLRERGVAMLVTALLLTASLPFAYVSFQQPFTPLPSYEIRRAALLRGTRRLFCEDFAWCSLALSRRSLRTFLDSRCDPFPLDVWAAFVDLESARSNWREIVERYSIDTVIAGSGHPLDQALRTDSRWRIITSGPRYTLFTRV